MLPTSHLTGCLTVACFASEKPRYREVSVNSAVGPSRKIMMKAEYACLKCDTRFTIEVTESESRSHLELRAYGCVPSVRSTCRYRTGSLQELRAYIRTHLSTLAHTLRSCQRPMPGLRSSLCIPMHLLTRSCPTTC